MKLNLVAEFSEEIFTKAESVKFLSDQIERYFNDRNYGSALEGIYVGVICVHPKFDTFCIVRKKLSKKRKILEYDIKLDFNYVNEADDDSIKKLIAETLINSTIILDEMKLKDFNTNMFKYDLLNFLINK